MAGTAIRLENLQKWFGQVKALSGIELEVPTGSVMGILGSERSGKTTIIHILATLLMPDDGRTIISGYDTRTDAHAVRRQIGLVGSGNAIEQHLSSRTVLNLLGRLHGLDRYSARRQADELLARFDLVDVADSPLATRSKLAQRRLDLAACVTGEPSVLLIDEPTSGIDCKDRPELWDLIQDLSGRGMTVLMASSNMNEVINLADSVAILHEGRIIIEESPQRLKMRVGQILEITASNHHQTATIVQHLGDMIDDRSRISSVSNVISITHSTPDLIIGTLDRLDTLGLCLSMVTVREPNPEETIRLLTAPLALVDELDIRDHCGIPHPGGSEETS